MKMRYVIVALAVIYIYILCDAAVGLAMDVIGEKIEIKNTDFSDIRVPKGYRMQATAYCLQGKTASGEYVRPGIIASKPEWIGKTAAVYLEGDNGDLGKFLGYYDVRDTGSSPIREGKVIDIWMPTYDECIQFGRCKVIVYILGEDDEKTEEIDLHTETKAV